MVAPDPTRRRTRAAVVPLVALAVVLQLGAALVSATVLQDGQRDAPAAAPARARAVPATEPTSAPPTSRRDRVGPVERLLQDRARAVRSRDREAFLATVDPSARELLARQAATFDALAQVPVGTWDYVLDPTRTAAPDETLDRRYGRDRWWAPAVSLRYALAGFDERPVVVDHHLTFVLRDGRWLLGADDDFALQGRATPRAIWDRGPVVAVRDAGVLVLGHPGRRGLLEQVAVLTAAAVPRVTAAWGSWAQRVVVLVPDDTRELAGLLDSDADLSRIAAVATAELRGGDGEYDPAGDRVLVNPETFTGLGAVGRQVVITHEVTHVATRDASGPAVPGWLAEGFADLVGYTGVDLPLAVTAPDLAREVRAGRVPAALPADADFDAGSPLLSQAYQGAWLAVGLLDERHGRAALLRLYRAVGARRGVASSTAVEEALRTELGTTSAALTADWRASLQRRLA